METKLDITALKKSHIAFFNALQARSKLEQEFYDVYRAAIIQNFEFSFELAWKFMRRWLENEDKAEIEAALTKKDIFRLAHKFELIDDAGKWFIYLSARNKTSHTYDEGVAEEVFIVANEFFVCFGNFINQLEKRI